MPFTQTGMQIVGYSINMAGLCVFAGTNWENLEPIPVPICSIKGLSFGSKDYQKELKTVECTIFLGQTS